MDEATARSMEATGETVLLETHPSMFRESPLVFILFLLLIPVFGVGLVLLLGWWVLNKANHLTVTDKRLIHRKGLLSRHTNEVLHRDIRNVQIMQSFSQRVFRTGDLGVSSSGQDEIEIQFRGLADPHGVKALIDQHRLR